MKLLNKKFIFLIVLIVSVLFVINLSCKKETSCEGCRDNNNKPPIAVAGPNQVITLPTDSISLDGSSSSDPDGTISNWLWTKISGPASIIINNSSISNSVVKDLVKGIYQFELKVTDNGGLFSKDTVQVVVNDPLQPNRPPIANAGVDQIITLPINSITVNGNSSTDPDNNISTYLWTKISGPLSFNITNANATQTQVTNLTEGAYQFELKVTDAGGLFSKDTMQVTLFYLPCSQLPSVSTACDNSIRPQICAQLIPVGTLSQARFNLSVATAGNKILFAGGLGIGNWVPTSRVDIYDVVTQSWSTAELSVGRYAMATAAAGNKIFFGGGEVGDGTWPVATVDIYDVATNSWTVDHLSQAGNSIAAASVGNKVLFAGGDQGFNGTPGIANRAMQVDIYDLGTATWSTAQLSEWKRGGHAAVTVNDKIYFAGGEAWLNNSWFASNRVDIYDHISNTWSTSFMQEGKIAFASINVGNKIYWAGGHTGSFPAVYKSCVVEITDINTGNSALEYLFGPGEWWSGVGRNAVVKDNKIIFYRDSGSDSNKFDIYDVASNTWSIGVLPQSISEASIISVNNTIYIAGANINGAVSNQVWKLEF
jgi:hypothetical protein